MQTGGYSECPTTRHPGISLASQNFEIHGSINKNTNNYNEQNRDKKHEQGMNTLHLFFISRLTIEKFLNPDWSVFS